MISAEMFLNAHTILVVIFVVMFVVDKFVCHDQLLDWAGGESFKYMQGREWYRVLTGSFFHHDLFHLAGNAFGMYFIGMILEDEIGSWTFLAIYLIGNIGAYTVYSIFGDYTEWAGASPGIYALIACMIILHIGDFLNVHFGHLPVSYTFAYLILGNLFGKGTFTVHVLGFSLGMISTLLYLLF